MSRFSILLVENKISIATTIVQVVSQQLASYELWVARTVAEAIARQEAVHLLLVNVSQLSDDVSGTLSTLTESFSDTPIVVFQETAVEGNEAREKLLLKALSAGAHDYVSLSEVGLLVLGRRITALHTAWQNQQPEEKPQADMAFGELLYNALVGNASQLAVILIRSDNRVRVWNQAAEGFFGLKAEEAVGSPIDALPLSPQNLSRLKDILDQARAMGEPFSIPTYPMEDQHKKTRWVRVHVYPLHNDPYARIADVCIISTDLTDLKQAEVENWGYNQELQILLETSQEFSRHLELQPTLEKIVDQAKSLLNADNCLVYFLEKDNKTLRPALTVGPLSNQIQTTSLTIGKGVIGTAAATGRAAMINFADKQGDILYGLPTTALDSPGEHVLCTPLTALKGMIGLMVATRSNKTPFEAEDLRFFESLVQQASLAVNNARLFEEAQRNLNELAILYEANAAISTTWNTQAVLNNLIRQMVQALDVSSGHIVSWNKSQNRGVIQAEFMNEAVRTQLDEAELGHTFNLTERPSLLTIINQQRPAFFQLSNPVLHETERKDMEKHGCQSRLLVPLVIKGETIGWAELWETRQERLFSADEVRLARALANQAAVALENAQYLRQTQKTLEETTALYQVASALATTQDAQTIMSTVAQEYLRVLGLKQGSVVIFDFEARSGVVKVGFQDDKAFAASSEGGRKRGYLRGVAEGRQISLENNPVYERLMRNHQPVVIEDIGADWLAPGSASAAPLSVGAGWAGEGALSTLVVPIQVRGEIVGAIVAEATRQERAFDPWEISLGQAMADQLGIALQNAQLFEAEHERRQQAETLREVSFVVGSSLNLNEVLERILDQLGRVVKYDSAAIHLIEGNRRRIIAGRGFPHPEQVIGLSFPVKSSEDEPGATVIRTRQPLVIGNISETAGVFSKPAHDRIKSWLGIPLIARDKVIGLISIEHVGVNAYHEEDVQLAMAFANQVAIALENARLHELEVRELERELEIAQGIQEALLPQFVPQVPGLQISGRLLPARQIGGDFFHFFTTGEEQLGVAIGDVSGKGIPAALYMAAAITAIDTKISDGLAPAELLNHLNRTLYNRLQENKMNIGLQIATFTPLPPPEDERKGVEKAKGSMMTVASGGMISPIGATEHGCRYLPVSGLPVGSFSPEQIYHEDIFLLDPFTTIIFTSDGIVEAQNEVGELFGFERLEATISEIISTRDAETIAEHIIEAAQIFMGDAEQTDDMTVMVVVKKER